MRNFVIVLIIYISGVFCVSGQIPAPDSYLVSPNAASLGEYGEVPVSLYTGTPEINIPIYEAKVGHNHSIPVSLSYRSGGVKVDQHPGWTGLGWSLNAGGCISRVVKGMPDETKHYNYVSVHQQYPYLDIEPGYFYGKRFNPDSTRITQLDYEPDKFVFNFLDFQGSFYYAGQNNWAVVCNRPIKIVFDINDNSNYFRTFFKNISDERYEYFNLIRSISINNFQIIDEYGNKYTFGSKTDTSMSAIEFSVGFFNQPTDIIAATTWYLTKIEYTDGHVVTFNYFKGPRIAQLGVYENYTVTTIPRLNMVGSIKITYNGKSDKFAGNDLNFVQGSLIFPSYLKSIDSDDSSIEFTSQESNELKYNFKQLYNNHHGEIPSDHNDMIYLKHFNHYCKNNISGGKSIYDIMDDSIKWLKLTDIKVRYADKNIKHYKFKYNDESADTKGKYRLALMSVEEICNSSRPKYNFEYNNLNDLPEYCTYDIDHWGYYKKTDIYDPQKNRRNVTFFKNEIDEYLQYRDSTFDNCVDSIRNQYSHAPAKSKILSDYHKIRNPDASKAHYGVLSKITYPTKGYTRFEYEPHTYSQVVSEPRDSLKILNENEIAGGVRIKKIFNSESGLSSDEIISKEYFYHDIFKNFGNDHFDSGILLSPVRYDFFHTKNDNNFPTTLCYCSQSVFPLSSEYDGTHIGYSCVSEKYPDGSYTIHNFTNYSYADYRDVPGDYYGVCFGIYFPYTSKAFTRGKLMSRQGYSSLNKLVKSEDYSYDCKFSYDPEINIHNKVFNEFIAEDGFRYVYFEDCLYSILPLIPILTGTSTTDYSSNSLQPVTTESKTTEFCGLLPRTQMLSNTNSNNCVYTTYTYPSDYSEQAGSSQVYKEMVDANCIALPVSCTKKRTVNGITATTNSVSYTYSLNNLVAPTQMSVFGRGATESVQTQWEYDSAYNPILEQNTYSQTPTIYVWGYHSRYIVAKIENATMQQVKSVIGDFGTFASASTPDFSKIQSLRDNFPDAHITTFRYEPLVGLKELVTPDGIITKYIYDDAGRLKMKVDGDGNIIEEYEYKYAD